MDRRFDDALPLFERAVTDSPGVALAHAWLGFTWLRLEKQEAAWREAHAALALDPCCTVGWEVLSRALNPQYGAWDRSGPDSAWACLLAGARCDSLDGELAEDLWIGALERGDDSLATRAVRSLHASRLLREPLLAYARWTLAELPARAVLLVNGDADCYPVLVVQHAEGYRSDVTLVHLSLLALPWYRRYARDRLGLPMPFAPEVLDTLDFRADGGGGWIPPTRDIVDGWMGMLADGSFSRPLAIAVTAETQYVPDRVELCGAYWRLDPGLAPLPLGEKVDTAVTRRGLVRLRAADFTGEPVSDAARSPYMRGTGAMIRDNLTSAVVAHYQACRRAGAAREAEELRAWALAFLARIRVRDEYLDVVRTLPQRWGQRGR